MSLIKKPKRNFRSRGNENDDSENEQPELASTSVDKPPKKTKKPVVHQPLLSFGEDLNEGLPVIIALCGAIIETFCSSHISMECYKMLNSCTLFD